MNLLIGRPHAEALCLLREDRDEIKGLCRHVGFVGIERRKLARSVIPAVTHVDGSARLQTVTRAQHATFYDLLAEFDRQTGCPVLINTSFNVRGEPIVCTPHDAYLCFMRTEMDYLVVEGFFLDKKDQPNWQDDASWQDEFELD